jgi:hypothetical protein
MVSVQLSYGHAVLKKGQTNRRLERAARSRVEKGASGTTLGEMKMKIAGFPIVETDIVERRTRGRTRGRGRTRRGR